MSDSFGQMFPDLSASVIASVEKECNTADQIVAALQQLSSTEPSDDRKEAMWRDIVASFGPEYEELGRNKVFSILAQHHWDVESALGTLFQELADHQRKKTIDKANHILGDLIQGLDKEIIRQVFEKHDGDADQAAEELLERFGHRNKVETPEQKKAREQKDMINALIARHGISKEEAREVLAKAGWNPRDACLFLARKKKDQKVAMFTAEFPTLTTEQIREMCGADDTQTRDDLQKLVNLKAKADASPAPIPEHNEPPAPTSEHIQENEAAKHDAEAIAQYIAAQDPRALAKHRLAATIRIDGPENQVPQQELERTKKAPPVENPEAFGLAVNAVRLQVPKLVEVGQSFTVTVIDPDADPTAPKQTPNDWVGMYFENQPESYYQTYQWLYLGTQATFTAPSTCSKIFFRYFPDKTYRATGQSAIIHVGPMLKLHPTTVSSTEIQVRVENVTATPLPNLWVAVYHHKERDYIRNPLVWDWISNAKENTLTFKIPKVGGYTIRGFPFRSHDYAAEIAVNVEGTDRLDLNFLPQGDITINYSITTVDPIADKVWIGIYREDERDNRQYLKYKKVSTNESVLTMKPLDKAGTYQARFFACGSYDTIGCSSPKLWQGPENQ